MTPALRPVVTITTVTTIMSCAALLACSAQVLSLPGDAGPNANAPYSAPPRTTVADLTEAQAGDLCTWIYNEYPEPSPRSGRPPSSVKGYAGSVGITIGEVSPDGRMLTWVRLSPEDCILNLRHGGCEAQVASVQSCISYWANGAAPASTSAGRYSDVETACAGLLDAKGCDQTVLQGDYSSPGDWCAFALPIEPGVVCTPPDGADGGQPSASP
jgi:hypothetical protein